MAARQHHGIDAPRALCAHHRQAGVGVDARLREKAAGHGQLPARHGDGAMVEINAERIFDRVFQHAERLHVIGERAVAKTRALFRGRHRFVDGDRRIVGKKLHEAQNFAQGLARLMARQDHVGDGDGARVDKRIARDAAFALQLHDGVERAARGLAADAAPQPVAHFAERQGEREHLRDALDRERRVAVAAHAHGAVVGHDSDAEGRVADARQFGNVGRHLAAVGARAHFIGDVFDDTVDVGHGRAHENTMQKEQRREGGPEGAQVAARETARAVHA